MVITSSGNGCFKIQTGGLTLMTEPFEGELSGRFKPDILLTQLPANSYQLADTFVVSGPGEYEIKGIEISGYPKKNYLIVAEEIRLGFLDQETTEIDTFGDVDILFVPVSEKAAKVIKDLEPKIVIPSIGDHASLIKAFNQKPEVLEKLTIKKKEVPAVGPKIVVLKS
jgi:L-ascorbate metabolism protein UlaG (beta-lactamase superfamily)